MDEKADISGSNTQAKRSSALAAYRDEPVSWKSVRACVEALIHLSGPDAAEDFLKGELAQQPNDHRISGVLADLLLEEERTEEARDLLTSLEEQFGESAWLLRREAKLLTATNQLEHALLVLAKVLEVEPEDRTTQRQVGHVHRLLGDYSAAASSGHGLIRSKPPIVQIGFNRCGTTSFHNFFRANGLTSMHWDEGRLAKAIDSNVNADRAALAGYETIDAFTDLEWVSGQTGEMLYAHIEHFESIAADYPQARFILNTRDRHDWIVSRQAHRHDGWAYDELCAQILGLTIEETLEHWSNQWETHHKNVRRYFANEPERLLEIHLGHADIKSLVEFLKPWGEADPSLWDRHNATPV